MDNYYIGVDIGGTKTNICLVDRDFNIKRRDSFKTQPLRGGKYILDQLAWHIEKLILENRPKILGLGIGAAGQISNLGQVKSSTDTFRDWVGVDIKKEMESRLNIETRVINDVQAMALGELLYSKLENFLCIALGTGVGGAIIQEGKLMRGSTGAAGEFGHINLYPEGRLCSCGQKGCAEAYLSGAIFQKMYYDKYGKAKQLSEIFNEDRVVLEKYLFDLEVFLASLVNIFSPEEIVINGGISRSLIEYIPEINKNVSKIVLPINQSVVIRVSDIGSDAMLIGSASQFL